MPTCSDTPDRFPGDVDPKLAPSGLVVEEKRVRKARVIVRVAGQLIWQVLPTSLDVAAEGPMVIVGQHVPKANISQTLGGGGVTLKTTLYRDVHIHVYV
jgi:hypothetical protein